MFAMNEIQPVLQMARQSTSSSQRILPEKIANPVGCGWVFSWLVAAMQKSSPNAFRGPEKWGWFNRRKGFYQSALPDAIRINHSNTEIERIKNSNVIANRDIQLPRLRTPRMLMAIKKGTDRLANKHSITPAVFALNPPSISPFNVCAHDVVIPQPGQRIPKMVTIVQPGNPS